MGQFQLYFQLGVKHILDLAGFDHILFIIALCAIYLARDWKKILILVTAFTIGHSITLALATLNLVRVNTNLVEFLIPLTILLTSLANLLKPKAYTNRGLQLNYVFALFFGLVHGFGFSSYLKSILGSGSNIFQPLMAFNIGLEIGQLVIVGIFLLTSSLLIAIFGFNRKEWTLVISAIIFGMSFILLLESKYW